MTHDGTSGAVGMSFRNAELWAFFGFSVGKKFLDRNLAVFNFVIFLLPA